MSIRRQQEHRTLAITLLTAALVTTTSILMIQWLKQRERKRRQGREHGTSISTTSNPIRAHFYLAKIGMSDTTVALFKSLLDERVTLTHGEEVAEDVEVLISNMPKDEFYEVKALKAVILPYAGPPPSVVSKIRDHHPHLTLHNLHSNAVSTAEMGIGLLLAAAKLIVPADRMLREGDWRAGGGLALSAADIKFAPMHQVILEGKTALILGLGEVGSRIADSCKALGMHVCGVRRSTKSPHLRPGDDGVWVYPTSCLPELLPRATAVFVCMPSTPETRGLVGREELSLLGSEAIVVNIGRGEIIDEEALYEVLAAKKIHAAGLDVWWQYPSKDSKSHERHHPSRYDFHALDNVVMSPHRGGAPGLQESEERRIQALAHMLNQALQGGGLHALPNRVPLDRGY